MKIKIPLRFLSRLTMCWLVAAAVCALPDQHAVCGPGSQHGLTAVGSRGAWGARMPAQRTHHGAPAHWGSTGGCQLQNAQ
jgi:hypothetical protein